MVSLLWRGVIQTSKPRRRGLVFGDVRKLLLGLLAGLILIALLAALSGLLGLLAWILVGLTALLARLACSDRPADHLDPAGPFGCFDSWMLAFGC
jgi:hypothetical protein